MKVGYAVSAKSQDGFVGGAARRPLPASSPAKAPDAAARASAATIRFVVGEGARRRGERERDGDRPPGAHPPSARITPTIRVPSTTIANAARHEP